MRISQQYQFVFISTPKCCTHTMYEYLSRHYGPLIQRGFHNADLPDDINTTDYCIWSVTRNPYSRIVSLWWTTTVRTPDDHYQIREKITGDRDGKVDLLTFMRWLPSVHDQGGLWQSQSHWLRNTPMTHMVRQEDLPHGMSSLPWWNGPNELPKLNTSTTNPPNPGPGDWRQWITPEIAELIQAWAGKDFEQYGYDVESWRA